MAQPEGIARSSAVVAPEFDWTDGDFVAPPLSEWVLYELHVGTFTAAGTFAGAVAHLDGLVDLGVNAIELMPVAEFPGVRNWGYDGVLLWAAHHAYGGLDGLRVFVDACHARGIAVVLDVVYNHLGPEGNHLAEFGPFFTDTYRTPWGAALNFDGAGSDVVREFFVENARFWVQHAHVDGLRLDAVHAIVDPTAYSFVEELTDALHRTGAELGRAVTVIAESADNDSRLTAPVAAGGRGLDAQWSDDFHHALHVALTGERDGYYIDFAGTDDLAGAMHDGFVYRGRHSEFRGRRHGRTQPPVALDRLVVFGQNHDQIGNRARGERLIALAGFEAAKTSMAVTLLAPSLPLLFMGEEIAARQPFPYFVHHSDPALVEAVRRGRAEEFAGWAGEPLDPQAEETFVAAVLDPGARGGEADAMRDLCRDLVGLRRSRTALRPGADLRPRVRSDPEAETLLVARGHGDDEVLVVVSFARMPTRAGPADPAWRVRLDTAALRYGGPGVEDDPSAPLAPCSVRVLTR